MLVRSLLDTLLESMNSTTEAGRPSRPPPPEGGDQGPEEVQPEFPASSHSSRILNLIAFLMNQAPIKAAFLQLTKGGYVLLNIQVSVQTCFYSFLVYFVPNN